MGNGIATAVVAKWEGDRADPGIHDAAPVAVLRA
jgi:hypothetical protein